MRQNHERLEALRSLALLDTAAEVVYDDLTRTLAKSFDVPISMVNLGLLTRQARPLAPAVSRLLGYLRECGKG